MPKQDNMAMTRRSIYIFDADYKRAEALAKKHHIRDKATLIRETIARNLEQTAKDMGR